MPAALTAGARWLLGALVGRERWRSDGRGEDDLPSEVRWEYQMDVGGVWITARTYTERPAETPDDEFPPHGEWRLVRRETAVIERGVRR